MEYYNVTYRSEFKIKIEDCATPIEELSDHFITQEQLRTEYHEGCYTDFSNGNPNEVEYLNAAAIRAVVSEWADLLGDTKISTTKTTKQVDAMWYETSGNTYLINEILNTTPWKVSNGRVIHKEREAIRADERKKEQKQARIEKVKAKALEPYTRPQEVTSNEFFKLKRAVNRLAEQKYGIDISAYLPRSNLDCAKTITGFKRLANWQEVAKELREFIPKKQHKEDLKFAKMLWNDPSTYK